MENYKCDYTFLLLSVKLDNDVKQVSEFEKKELFDPNNIAIHVAQNFVNFAAGTVAW